MEPSTVSIMTVNFNPLFVHEAIGEYSPPPTQAHPPTHIDSNKTNFLLTFCLVCTVCIYIFTQIVFYLSLDMYYLDIIYSI
jgi:hypothetical protein